MSAVIKSFASETPEFLPDHVLSRVLPLQVSKTKSASEAKAFSLNAAGRGGFHEPFAFEASYLHRALIEERADQMTCYAAWALYLDLKLYS